MELVLRGIAFKHVPLENFGIFYRVCKKCSGGGWTPLSCMATPLSVFGIFTCRIAFNWLLQYQTISLQMTAFAFLVCYFGLNYHCMLPEVYCSVYQYLQCRNMLHKLCNSSLILFCIFYQSKASNYVQAVNNQVLTLPSLEQTVSKKRVEESSGNRYKHHANISSTSQPLKLLKFFLPT